MFRSYALGDHSAQPPPRYRPSDAAGLFWAAPERSIRPWLAYGTTITMQGARLATFCDTLPSSKPASCPRPRSADHDSILLLASGGFDDPLRRIAPSNFDFDSGCPDLSCSLFGLQENLVRDGIKRIVEISLGAGKRPHLIARKVSPDGWNGELASQGLCKLGGDVERAVCSLGTVCGYHDVRH